MKYLYEFLSYFSKLSKLFSFFFKAFARNFMVRQGININIKGGHIHQHS